jgi:hypothetical protein
VSDGSSESSSSSSSPDSIYEDSMQNKVFKPISRELKTPNSSKPPLLRIPSIRTPSSNSPDVLPSLCPSPFFIPITPKRQSAFSVVKEEEFVLPKLVKPKAKRKNAEILEVSGGKKRTKRDAKPRQIAYVAGQVEAKTEKRKTRSGDNMKSPKKSPQVEVKTTRVTRSQSMKKKF